MNILRESFVLAGLVAVGASGATEILRAVHPSVSPDGKTVLVSYQGDIWSVPTAGGEARRLTIHPERDQMPRFLPDGKSVLFVSSRNGSQDIYRMKLDGSGIQRLNHETSNEQLFSVSPDGKWAYGYTNAWGRMDLYRLSTSGGDIIRISGGDLELEYYPSPVGNGNQIAFVGGGSPGSWRRPGMHGSNTGEIWIADAGVPLRNFRKLTDNEKNDMFPLGAPDGTIYFVSNRAGVPNIWRMKSDGKGASQITRFEKGTVRWPSISADGKTIVFEQQSRIYRLDTATGKYDPIAIDVPEDLRTNPEVTLNLTSGADGYAISPDGKRAIIAARGDLWLIPEKGGTTRKLTSSIAMDQLPVWLDPQTVLFTTGRTGKRELWTVNLKGEEKVFAAASTDVGNASLSPDGKLVAYFRGAREIVVRPVAGGPEVVVATGAFQGGFAGFDFFNWSPDSKWLAVAMATDRGGTNVHLAPADGKGDHLLVGRMARNASAPRWLPNGRGIFLTGREYENNDLFVIDLQPEAITFTEDDLDKLDEPKAEAKKEAVEVKVHLPGIFDRMRRLTSDGAFEPIASSDSRTIWASVNGAITGFNVQTGAASPVPGLTVWSQPKVIGNKVYFLSGGRLNALTLGQPAPAPVNFSATAPINLREEEKALFDEIWWAMDRFYYDPEMHGKDWAGIKARYAAVLPFTTDRTDFYALMAEMLEELESSHLGATPPTESVTPPGQVDSTAFLGVEWDWNTLASTGQYRVARVHAATPASHPQSELKVGDVILGVDGRALDASYRMPQALNLKTGRKVQLQVRRGSEVLPILIKPASPAIGSRVNYASWVENNRRLVDQLSGGQLAYHHYEGMNQPSQELFLREIRTLTVGKKGIIIDVRFNGGGSTAHQALGVLIKSPWLIRTRRDLPGQKLSENIYRGDSLELPSALMINQYSFSNAEIFAEGFRRLRVGPVVGEATAGGVIGTSAYGLWDGGQIRMPAAGAFAVDGENLENNGRKPDIRVLWDPNAALEGRDVQLEAAVRELMKKIR